MLSGDTAILHRWDNTIAVVPDRIKRYVWAALQAGADDKEIAEATGLDYDQMAAIRAVTTR